jgi:Replication-relaxation
VIPLASLRSQRERPPWTSAPRPIPQDEVAVGVRTWDLAPRNRAVLDLTGRHPFLPAGVLADVLGWEVRSVRAAQAVLVQRGLARVVLPPELPRAVGGGADLLELTVDGLRLLAGYLGLSLASAVRHHGLAGGGPAMPVGPRRALVNRLAHTLGADAIFAALARAARNQRGELLEWRNAAACAHARVRPDGYGLLKLGRREHGFFLEFDRGTVRPAALRAKFVAYHRYCSSGRAAREYDGLPVVLVVTVGPAAEDRIADAVVAVHGACGGPLSIFVTTTAWIAVNADGILGRIWCRPGSPGRLRWPYVPREI